MKRKKMPVLLLTAVCCLAMLPTAAVATTAAEPATQTEIMVSDTELVDSGLSYVETVETIANPGAGYTTTDWYTCAPGNTPIHDKNGNVVLMFIDIGKFSSGANGTTNEDGTYVEGTDYDLDEQFFQNVRASFENCRKNGSTIAVRFRYDANGKDNPEPATFDQVLRHIQQIKENGLLEDYKDILMFVETGFVGKWGEQHGGKYTSLDYKVQLVNAMLDCVPKEVPITVRTPNIFEKWAGITTEEMATYVAEPDSDAARIGLYNDGYMGSDSDLGTYSNRAAQTAWMEKQMEHTYYGGGFFGDLDLGVTCDTYLPENAIPEMYRTHLSYINANIYQLYKDYTFGKEYDVENGDHSAYYGQTVFQFIRDHLGYRFVIRDSKLSKQVTAGDTLQCQLSIENTGFANPIRKMKAEVLLEKDGDYIQTTVDIDPTTWLSCTTTDIPLTIQLPGDLEAGNWNVYLRLSIGNQDIPDSTLRTVHFANADVWDGMLGANRIGTVAVTAATDAEQLTQHNFYQVTETPMISDGSRYTRKEVVSTDGKRSGETEWREDALYHNEDNSNLYLTNDDQYLYVMAEMPMEDVVSPVYNLQIIHADPKNPTATKRYWMYHMRNGYVYFNQGSYAGTACKYNGNCVEWKIPFSVLELEPGTELTSVRVMIQDSSVDGWKVTSDQYADRSYVVTDTFLTYNAPRSMVLKEGESISLSTVTTLTGATYQWYHDDVAIPDATESQYTISDATTDTIGSYTVEITAPSGTKKTLSICDVTDVLSSVKMGDVNGDAFVDLLDVVLLQKYLIRKTDGSEINVQQADCQPDETLDVLDLVVLKRMLFPPSEPETEQGL